MPTAETNLYAARRPAQLTIPTCGKVGSLRYTKGCEESESQGFNLATSSGQITTITFPAPGTLPVGGKVYLTLKRADCSELALELHSCTGTTPASLADLLVERINGTAAGVSQSDMAGYSASKTSPTVVVITGPPGKKFTLIPSEFGITRNVALNPATPTVFTAVVHPAAPTIAVTTAATATAKIPFGVAVGIDPVATEIAYAGKQTPGISQAYNKIVTLPKPPTSTWKFKGISILDDNRELPMPTSGCCDVEKDCSEGYDCGKCVHYLNSCCHSQEIAVKLEPFPANAVIPAGGWGQAPLYYRHTAKPGYTQLGALSIFPNPADTTVAACVDLNTGREWVVTSVGSNAEMTVYAGIAGAN
jgi:hypothetical protein